MDTSSVVCSFFLISFQWNKTTLTKKVLQLRKWITKTVCLGLAVCAWWCLDEQMSSLFIWVMSLNNIQYIKTMNYSKNLTRQNTDPKLPLHNLLIWAKTMLVREGVSYSYCFENTEVLVWVPSCSLQHSLLEPTVFFWSTCSFKARELL